MGGNSSTLFDCTHVKWGMSGEQKVAEITSVGCSEVISPTVGSGAPVLGDAVVG